jgi:thiosulfate/3-mercaptopyruvate sulfurtransferase
MPERFRCLKPDPFPMQDKERPVIVFTNTGFTASVVWFALELMGFDAKLYSYKDWIINQAEEQNKVI